MAWTWEQIAERAPAATAVLIQLGTLAVTLLGGFPQDQLRQMIGSKLVIGALGEKTTEDVKVPEQGVADWGQQLVVSTGTALLAHPWRLVVIAVLAALFVQLLRSQGKARGWIARVPSKYRIIPLIGAIGLTLSVAAIDWRVGPDFQGPLMLRDLGQYQMDPRRFRSPEGQPTSRDAIVGYKLYAWLHGVDPARPIAPRRDPTPNYCRCPSDANYESATGHEQNLLWVALATTILLLVVSQLPSVFARTRNLRTRPDLFLTCALAIAVVFHVRLWYQCARNLGVLEGVSFLHGDAACIDDPHQAQTWPFCKPYFTLGEVPPPPSAADPRRSSFDVHNVWPANALASSNEIVFATSVKGEQGPVAWPVRLDAPGVAFNKGALRLGFGPEDLAQTITGLRSNIVNPVVEQIGVTDGQSSAEWSLVEVTP